MAHHRFVLERLRDAQKAAQLWGQMLAAKYTLTAQDRVTDDGMIESQG